MVLCEQDAALADKLKASQIKLKAAAVKVERGDGVSLLRRVSCGSLQLVFLDPPYESTALEAALKAANLKEMIALNPEAKFVRTGNANINAAMLKINIELGFKPYFTSIVWQGNTDAILEKLA